MILDEFVLRFVSNTSQAEAGNKRLEESTKRVQQATEELSRAREEADKKSGKKYTDEQLAVKAAQKNLTEYKAQQKKDERELLDLQKQRNDASGQYLNLVKTGAAATAAILGIGGFRQGVTQAFNQNLSLEQLQKNTGLDIKQLKKAQALFAKEGDDGSGFTAFFLNAKAFANAANAKLNQPDDILNAIHERALSLPEAQRPGYLNSQGITGIPLQNSFLANDAEWKKSQAEINKQISNQPHDSSALEFTHQIKDLSTNLTNVFSNLESVVLPRLSSAIELLNKWLESVKDSPTANAIIGGSEAGIGAYGLAKLFKGAAKLFGGGGAGVAAGEVGTAEGIGSTPLGLAALAIGGTAWWALGKEQEGAKWIAKKIKDRRGNGSIQSTDKEDYDYWRSLGYSGTQASTLIGNSRGEGWNGGAIGDGGTAFGKAQWHNDRVQDILKNTGIDVRTASNDKQLEAQAWEMKNRYGITPDTLPDDYTSGAAYLVHNYEKSKNQSSDTVKRAQYAMDFAASNSGVSRGASGSWADGDKNVSIGDVNVYTSADSFKGATPDLVYQLGNLIADADDGRAK